MSFAERMKTIVVATDLDGQSELPWSMPASWREHTGRASCWRNGIDPVNYAALDEIPGPVLQGMSEAARRRSTRWPAICCARAFTAIPRFARERWHRCCWTWRGNTRPG